MIGEPMGVTPARSISLPSTGFYSEPAWSPDGKLILVQDNHNNLWTIEVASGKAEKIDTDNHPDPFRNFGASWSPDSKWVTYSKNLPSHLRAIFVYSVADKSSHQVTDGLADSVSPTFDAGGKFLYFLSSTDYGPSTSWLEMSSLDRPVRRSIYLAVLSADEPSPLLPESDDEKTAPGDTPKPSAPPSPAPAPAALRIDFNGIGQRIISVNVPARDYANLTAGPAETFFYTEAIAGGGGLRLHKYQIKQRRAVPFVEGIRDYSVSADRKKLLYQAGVGAGASFGIVGTDSPAKVGDGPLNVAQLEMKVDPRAEWAQIYRETWRFQREYFYDPKMHGADWNAIYEKYRPLLEAVGHRADLSYVVAMIGGELTVGHSYLTGEGDVPTENAAPVGLLGADLSIENGRYRISRIYSGENWNPDLRAPLSAPGIRVAEGDYILEVNGRPLVPPCQSV
jgi:tricorn protease